MEKVSRNALLKQQMSAASQGGGWVPKTSRSVHYWEPAPRWRLPLWLANPGNPAMSSQAIELPDNRVEREERGREGETTSEQSPHT